MSGDGLPFIPAALDELGLDVYAYRLYGHICRRAGADGTFYGGGLKVARTCCMSLRQVRRAVCELRSRELLEVLTERKGCPTAYRPKPAHQCPTGTGAPQARDQCLTGTPTSAPQAHKGTPLKVLPEGTSLGATRRVATSRRKRPKGNGNGAGKATPTTTATAAGMVVEVEVLPPGSTAPWSSEAGDDWREALGGTVKYGRIGDALKPLVLEHGWDVVRPVWRRFLGSKDGKYGAEYFAQRFGLYATGQSQGNGRTAATRQTLVEFATTAAGEAKPGSGTR